MPYSFTKIESDHSRSILGLFVVLTLFYFTVTLVFIWALRFGFYLIQDTQRFINVYELETHWFNFWELGIAFIFALVIAGLHWSITTRNIVHRTLVVLRALPAETVDNHGAKQFQNILQEISVATGGPVLEGYVIPSSQLNAFSLTDFDGRQVIGVTQGILSKLSRGHLEAIVAHEAAHVLKGDALLTTVASSLFHLPYEIMRDFALDDDNLPTMIFLAGRGAFFSIFFFIQSFLIKTIGQFINMCISRKRDLRADMIAVRLTRNPLTFAEALFIVAHSWRGSGLIGENLEAIFLVSPKSRYLDAQSGLFADVFSAHPPMEQRISLLLEFAHTNEETFLKSVDQHYQKYPLIVRTDGKLEEKWLLRRDREWTGPFTIEEICEFDWIQPETMVKQMGAMVVTAALFDPAVAATLEKPSKEQPQHLMCPYCYRRLNAVVYENATIQQCPHCLGVLVEEKDVERIMNCREKVFDEDIALFAEVVKENTHISNKAATESIQTNLCIYCPVCHAPQQRMERHFYSQEYPIEIDRCPKCRVVWFDQFELETLQYLYELNSEITDHDTAA